MVRADGSPGARTDALAAALTGFVCARPRQTLLAVLIVIVAFGAGLGRVSKDPSVDAFVPASHPAASARERASALFGLEDPIVIGVVGTEGRSVFTPAGLQLVSELHAAVRTVEGVEKNDVLSIATENAISGGDGELYVEPVLPEGPITDDSARTAWTRVQAMPMMIGLLASATGDTATVIVPVEDPDHAEATYTAVLALAEARTTPAYAVHVAGVAAMNAALGAAVDRDTRVFVPVAVLTVFGILFVALRRPTALIGPLIIVAGAAAIGIGTLGWAGARYYLITTALPVIIMAIAVADSLHLIAFYLRARREDPERDARAAVGLAVRHTLLPITLTSVTTVVGFLGLSLGAAMRPISEFGLFAAVGVGAAWGLSLTALPAVLVLADLKPRASPGGRAPAGASGGLARIDRLVAALSNASLAHPRRSLALVGAALAALALLAADARFDYQRSDYFTPGQPVKVADATLNARLGGINFLDVVVTAPEPEGLLTTAALAAIAELTARIETLPEVTHVVGIDDYLSLMHTALTGADPGTLPTRPRAPAQYLFLYEVSGAPEDFRQEIDHARENALIRAQLSTDRFVDTRPTVHELRDIVTAWSEEHGLIAEVSGRVAVNEGWMSLLERNHFLGLGLAVLLVFLATVVSFRSVRHALLAMVPVAFGILSVYAVMGLFGVSIAPATSMTAAISAGLGIDFGVHLISHLRRRLVAGASLAEALSRDYLIVGRACILAALALCAALGVVCLSSVPALRWFASLVAAGSVGSLFGALVILPAILTLVVPLREGTRRHA